jgi:hypothetical protein
MVSDAEMWISDVGSMMEVWISQVGLILVCVSPLLRCRSGEMVVPCAYPR